MKRLKSALTLSEITPRPLAY